MIDTVVQDTYFLASHPLAVRISDPEPAIIYVGPGTCSVPQWGRVCSFGKHSVPSEEIRVGEH